MKQEHRKKRKAALAAGDKWRYGDPLGTKGGSDVRYWPTPKAFDLLGLEPPNHPRYK